MIIPDLIILDRDGVINQDSTEYIKNPDEWIAIESSLQAIALLNQHKIKVAVASNQRGIGRGLLSENDLAAIHQKMVAKLQQKNAHIDAFRYCPALLRSHPDHKPNPGMLLSIMEELQCDPKIKPIYFVGDKISDLNAAINANCTPILVKTGYGTQTAIDIKSTDLEDTKTFESLWDFVHYLLGKGAK